MNRDALLDTGATACAISVTLAQDLCLDLEEDEEEVKVYTAAVDQTLRPVGKAQLKMRWKDVNGERRGTKIRVYVVYGLSQHIILSHDFTHNHPEVWSVARKVMTRAEEIDVLWFNKLSGKAQKTQQQLRAKRLEENRAKIEASTPTHVEGSSSSAALVPGSTSTSEPPSSDAAVSGSTDNGNQLPILTDNTKAAEG